MNKEGRIKEQKPLLWFFLFILVVSVVINYLQLRNFTEGEYIEFVSESIDSRGFYLSFSIREDFENLLRELVIRRARAVNRREDKVNGEENIEKSIREKFQKIFSVFRKKLSGGEKKVEEEKRIEGAVAIIAAFCFTMFDLTVFLTCFTISLPIGFVIGLGEAIYEKVKPRIQLLLKGEVSLESAYVSAYWHFLVLRSIPRAVLTCGALHICLMPLLSTRFGHTGAAAMLAVDAASGTVAAMIFVGRFIGRMPRA